MQIITSTIPNFLLNISIYIIRLPPPEKILSKESVVNKIINWVHWGGFIFPYYNLCSCITYRYTADETKRIYKNMKHKSIHPSWAAPGARSGIGKPTERIWLPYCRNQRDIKDISSLNMGTMSRKSQHAFSALPNPQMCAQIGAHTPVVKQTANIVFVHRSAWSGFPTSGHFHTKLNTSSNKRKRNRES